MGDIADMILDGTLCQCCGGIIDEVIETGEPIGYPTFCYDCSEE